MTNDEQRKKAAPRMWKGRQAVCRAVRFSGFVILSSFVIWHLSLDFDFSVENEFGRAGQADVGELAVVFLKADFEFIAPLHLHFDR